MANLIFATTNRNKFISLKEKLKFIDTNISLTELPNHLLKKSPVENGSNEKENVKLKANFYFSILKKSLLSEDDGIYFKSSINPKHKVKDFLKSIPNNNVNNIKSIFIKNKIERGFIKKEFYLITSKKRSTVSITIPFAIGITQIERDFVPTSHVFNNYFIPNGFSNPISKFSNNEKRLFFEKYFKNKFLKLFEEYIKI